MRKLQKVKPLRGLKAINGQWFYLFPHSPLATHYSPLPYFSQILSNGTKATKSVMMSNRHPGEVAEWSKAADC